MPSKMNIVIHPFAKGKFNIIETYQKYENMLPELALDYRKKWKPGYREGVMLCPVPGFRLNAFRPQSVILDSRTIDAVEFSFTPRSGTQEPPRKQLWCTHPDLTGVHPDHLDLILYSSQTLAEDGHNQLAPEEGNWEIIGITEGPMSPETLMYNHFGAQGEGGTNTNMSPEAFEAAMKESFHYWKNRVSVR